MSTTVCKVRWFRLLSCLRTKSEIRANVLTNDDEVREEYEKINIKRCQLIIISYY